MRHPPRLQITGRVKFPSNIWTTGAGAAARYNYLSYGFRFTTDDPSLHSWRMVPEQFLTNHSAPEKGGQWFVRLPSSPAAGGGGSSASKSMSSAPTHMVSCLVTAAGPGESGNRWCMGWYDEPTESWRDFSLPTTLPLPSPSHPPGVLHAASEASLHVNANTGVNVPPPPPPPGVSLSDAGPDATFFTAGYASGTLGQPEMGDRLLNIGWAVNLQFDPLHMKHSYDRSGGLTLPRELHYEPATQQILATPVRELATLRNATIASSGGISLPTGGAAVHTVNGTRGGAAAVRKTPVI